MADHPIVQKIRRAGIKHGTHGIHNLCCELRRPDRAPYLSDGELHEALSACGVRLAEDELRELCAALGAREGVAVDELVDALCGGLSRTRKTVVEKAFASLDGRGVGFVDAAELRAAHRAEQNPLVRVGRKTAADAHEEVFAALDRDGSGRVTREEFTAYYAGVSASVDSDELFAQVVEASWGPGGEAADSACGGWQGASFPEFQSVAKTGRSPAKLHCYMAFAIDGERPEAVVFELLPGKAPLACENFRALCTGERGTGVSGQPLHYKGLSIHRIRSAFCLQGGDVARDNGKGSDSIYGKKFEDESFVVEHDAPGVLTSANSGPNSNCSQFCIMLKAAPYLNGKNVAFGRVVKNLDFVHRMGKCGSDSGVPVRKITIVDCGQC